jgi:RNA polymerase sigma-70 factor (ECF subfamily)
MEPARPEVRSKTAQPPTLDFKELFESEFDYVWFTLRRLGVPTCDLEDLAHDVFIRIHKRLTDYDPSRPLRPWLFGFAYRLASDYRRLARHRFERLDERIEVADPAPSAADQLDRKQMLDLAWIALGDLDLEQRAVFILHDVEGLPASQIAEVLNIPLNTGYSRLRLARKQFSRTLARLRLRLRGGER